MCVCVHVCIDTLEALLICVHKIAEEEMRYSSLHVGETNKARVHERVRDEEFVNKFQLSAEI